MVKEGEKAVWGRGRRRGWVVEAEERKGVVDRIYTFVREARPCAKVASTEPKQRVAI